MDAERHYGVDVKHDNRCKAGKKKRRRNDRKMPYSFRRQGEVAPPVAVVQNEARECRHAYEKWKQCHHGTVMASIETSFGLGKRTLSLLFHFRVTAEEPSSRTRDPWASGRLPLCLLSARFALNYCVDDV